MANGIFSMAAFVAYTNKVANTANTDVYAALRADLKQNIGIAGYPSKDEIGIVDTITNFRFDNTAKVIPELVSGYMNDEKRKFNLPAATDKGTPATIEIVHKDETTSSGVAKLGNGKDPIPWTSTVAAHDEYKLTNNRDSFKK